MSNNPYDDLIEQPDGTFSAGPVKRTVEPFGRNKPYRPKVQGKKTQHNMETLLSVLKETGSPVQACEAIDIKPSTLKYWRQQDRVFDEACLDAHKQSTTRLETSVLDRAANGWEEPKYHEGIEVGAIRKYDNGLSLKVLERVRPEEYGPPKVEKLEITGANGGPVRMVTIDVKASLQELMQLGHSRLTEEYKALLERPLNKEKE